MTTKSEGSTLNKFLKSLCRTCFYLSLSPFVLPLTIPTPTPHFHPDISLPFSHSVLGCMGQQREGEMTMERKEGCSLGVYWIVPFSLPSQTETHLPSHLQPIVSLQTTRALFPRITCQHTHSHLCSPKRVTAWPDISTYRQSLTINRRSTGGTYIACTQLQCGAGVELVSEI